MIKSNILLCIAVLQNLLAEAQEKVRLAAEPAHELFRSQDQQLVDMLERVLQELHRVEAERKLGRELKEISLSSELTKKGGILSILSSPHAPAKFIEASGPFVLKKAKLPVKDNIFYKEEGVIRGI